jgi:chromosome segregation ATPase
MPKMSFTIKLAVPGTSDLKPPELEANCEIEMDADEDHERVKWEYYKKNYEKQFTEKLKGQIKHLKVPLTSMQKDIDNLRKELKEISKASFADLSKKITKMVAKGAAVDKKIEEYQWWAGKAVENFSQQQKLAWHPTFEKEAQAAAEKKIKRELQWKKARHIAGVVLRGVLVVSAAALAIAASIASFGAAAPAIAAIGVACAGIGGASALYKTGKDISSAVDLEKKSLNKLKKDLSDIAVHLGKTSSQVAGLPKHLDDASRYHSQRQKNLKDADAKVTELDKSIKALERHIAELRREGPEKLKIIDKLEKEKAKLLKNKDKTVKVLQECMKRNEELNRLYQEARELVGDLKKIDFTGPKKVVGSISRYGNFDSFVNAVDMLNGVAGNANTLAGAV